MHNRLGQLTMPLEEGKVYFGTGSDCQFTWDIETRERRASVAEDVRRFAQLCDGLDQIDFVMSMGTPSDVPAMDHYVHSFIQMIRGTVKPNVYTAQNHQDMEDIYTIACAVAGGEAELRAKPFLLLYAEPISPLLFNQESVGNLMFCAEKGIPGAYLPSPNTGGGGPITMAGALALGNAESLVGLLLTQLVRAGRAVPVRHERGCAGHAVDHRRLRRARLGAGDGGFQRHGPLLSPAGLGRRRRDRQQGRRCAGRVRGDEHDHECLHEPLQRGA